MSKIYYNSIPEQFIIKFGQTLNSNTRNAEQVAIYFERSYQINIAEELQFAYEKLKNLDSAYAFAKMAIELKDNIFNERKSIQLQTLTFRRDLKAKEFQHELENAKAAENLKSEQKLRNIFLAGFVFGDSYMCVGGLPVVNTTNAIDAVRAALEIHQFMQHHQQQRKKETKEAFEIRIGIHTGPVVAGIVGEKKFDYDIWGDTVNIASRMESSGEAGKVNISGSTYELVKDKLDCIHRGKIQAKGKGELDMYFVSRTLAP